VNQETEGKLLQPVFGVGHRTGHRWAGSHYHGHPPHATQKTRHHSAGASGGGGGGGGVDFVQDGMTVAES